MDKATKCVSDTLSVVRDYEEKMSYHMALSMYCHSKNDTVWGQHYSLAAERDLIGIYLIHPSRREKAAKTHPEYKWILGTYLENGKY